MIISASRRTDIPAYYSEWLFNRLKDENVLARNPMNIHQIGKINLSPDVVDGIVFWTKNPSPMMSRLSELEKYIYYFQFTLTSYGRDVEPNLPSKNDVLIPCFQRLSKTIGRERVIWRYDPILFNEHYTMDYHSKYFALMAAKLGDFTEKCTVSFLDFYKNTERNIKPLGIQHDTAEMQYEIMEKFAAIAAKYGFYIDTCSEKVELDRLNICHSCCIDKARFERLGGYEMKIGKDPNQRSECGCVASVDIGAYNTCRNGCLYCYANYSQTTVKKNSEAHNPKSALLFGEIGEDDVIKEREMKSCKEKQPSLF